MSEQIIVCQFCDGETGQIDVDGVTKPCPVCDCNPLIDFATVKSYAEQIDKLGAELSAARQKLQQQEAAGEKMRKLLYEIGYERVAAFDAALCEWEGK